MPQLIKQLWVYYQAKKNKQRNRPDLIKDHDYISPEQVYEDWTGRKHPNRKDGT